MILHCQDEDMKAGLLQVKNVFMRMWRRESEARTRGKGKKSESLPFRDLRGLQKKEMEETEEEELEKKKKEMENEMEELEKKNMELKKELERVVRSGGGLEELSSGAYFSEKRRRELEMERAELEKNNMELKKMLEKHKRETAELARCLLNSELGPKNFLLDSEMEKREKEKEKEGREAELVKRVEALELLLEGLLTREERRLGSRELTEMEKEDRERLKVNVEEVETNAHFGM